MSKMRVYIDASVFGGYFDEEFEGGTRTFFDTLLAGEVTALISDTLVAELVDAPERVQNLLERALTVDCERLSVTEQTYNLHNAYLTAAVLSENSADDALHVTHATAARADVIVSWNFKHLVNPTRIRGFNAVNAVQGHGPVVIMTPQDLTKAWKEEEDR